MALKRQIASIGMMMRPISQSGFAAALSPGKWVPSEKAQAEQSEMILRPLKGRRRPALTAPARRARRAA